jgi:shikimate dehydrogenase
MTNGFLPALTGSFSLPAGENPTVAVMEAAYAHHGVHARYINAEVDAEHLADAVRGAVAMGWLGFNCSMPHKVSVIEHVDRLTEAALAIGAVNCVIREGDELVGENTDGKGFVESLREVFDPAGATVLVLGAGGAARAIGVELALAGAATVSVAARDLKQREDLARAIEAVGSTTSRPVMWNGQLAVPMGVDVVVNATPVGMAPNGREIPAVDLDSLRGVRVVADVVFSPPRTRLLEAAGQRGCTTVDGLGMLVNQAAVAVARWTGVDPDRSVMRTALAEALGV